LVRKNRLECTKLYDRTDDQLTVDEFEKIGVMEQFESILPYRIIDPFGALKYPSCR
jgi:hypothetical protein